MFVVIVGMFFFFMVLSVGYRSGIFCDIYELQFNGFGFFIEKYIFFLGMIIVRNVRNVGIRDLDNNYQFVEIFIIVCMYYQINKDNFQYIFICEKLCEYKFNI